MKWRALLLTVVVSLIGACRIFGVAGPTGGPYPDACESLGFAERQCAAMVTRAKSQLGVYPPVDATAIDILPPPDRAGNIAGYMISRVRFHLSNGTERTEEIWCIGVIDVADLPCVKDPIIGVGTRHVDYDVPCTGGGDPPSGCATLPPTPRPQSQALARPLHVAVLDIPLDHLGPYEVEAGEAGLPDGAFTMSSASVVDERPDTFWIRDARLAIEPVDPARPPVGSIYREPFDGVEPVKVFLVFDVTELKSVSVLQVRDIVVE